METKVHVPFQQLLALVKSLTPAQKERLRQGLAEEKPALKDKIEFIEYLLHDPVYSNKAIQAIEENKKNNAAWRKKKS